MKKFLIKSCTAILLIIAIVLSTASCAVQGVINSTKEDDAGLKSETEISTVEKIEVDESEDPLAPTDKETAVSQITEAKKDTSDYFYFFENVKPSASSKDEASSAEEAKPSTEETDKPESSKEDDEDLTVDTESAETESTDTESAETESAETESADTERVDAESTETENTDASATTDSASTDEPADEDTELPKEEEADEPIDEDEEDFAASFDEWAKKYQEQTAFNLAIDCIAYDLYAGGFEVFKAFAIVGEDKIVPGIAFTNYEVCDQGEKTIYSCGFLQIMDGGASGEIGVTTADIENGVVVVPQGEFEDSVGFVVTLSVAMDSYSGILNESFFRYDQSSDYSVAITVCEDDRSVYDESIDLFNFNKNRFVFKGDLTYSSVDASPYFSDEAKAYKAAQDAIDLIIEEQEKNAFEGKQEVIIVFTEEAVNEYLANNQQGTVNGFLLEEISKIEVGENEFLVITPSGVQKEPIIDRDELAKARLTNGILGLLGGALMVTGSIFVAVITFGAGTPIAVGTIAAVTCAGTLVCAGSQIVEATQNVICGIKGDIETEAVNPMLEVFKKMIPDEEKAAKIYHITGLACSIAQALIVPANAALSISSAAKAAGATVTAWQTFLSVGRAVVVEGAKIGLSALASVAVSKGAGKLVINLGGSEALSQIVGFGSALVAGALAYGALHKIDTKFNFSGIHKVQISQINQNDKMKKFDSDENLQSHFEKHKDDFRGMFENKDQYLEAANYVIETGEYIPELNGYFKFWGVGEKGKTYYAFVGMKNNGQNISTFHIKSVSELSKITSLFVK